MSKIQWEKVESGRYLGWIESRCVFKIIFRMHPDRLLLYKKGKNFWLEAKPINRFSTVKAAKSAAEKMLNGTTIDA